MVRTGKQHLLPTAELAEHAERPHDTLEHERVTGLLVQCEVAYGGTDVLQHAGVGRATANTYKRADDVMLGDEQFAVLVIERENADETSAVSEDGLTRVEAGVHGTAQADKQGQERHRHLHNG
jgi:hypothetical protein